MCIDLHAYSSLAITAVVYILLLLLYVLVYDKSARGDSIKTSFRRGQVSKIAFDKNTQSRRARHPINLKE